MSITAIIKTDHMRVNACAPAAPLMAAIKIMAKESVNGLAVVDKAEQLVGIITGHDIVKALAEDGFIMDKAHVHQYMSTQVITCNWNVSLSGALLKMKRYNIQHLVILDKEEILAVLSIKDILDKMHQNDLMELSVLKDIAVAHKVATVN